MEVSSERERTVLMLKRFRRLRRWDTRRRNSRRTEKLVWTRWSSTLNVRSSLILISFACILISGACFVLKGVLSTTRLVSFCPFLRRTFRSFRSIFVLAHCHAFHYFRQPSGSNFHQPSQAGLREGVLALPNLSLFHSQRTEHFFLV